MRDKNKYTLGFSTITPEIAAEELEVSVLEVRKMCLAGFLDHHKTEGGHYKIKAYPKDSINHEAIKMLLELSDKVDSLTELLITYISKDISTKKQRRII